MSIFSQFLVHFLFIFYSIVFHFFVHLLSIFRSIFVHFLSFFVQFFVIFCQYLVLKNIKRIEIVSTLFMKVLSYPNKFHQNLLSFMKPLQSHLAKRKKWNENGEKTGRFFAHLRALKSPYSVKIAFKSPLLPF